MLPVLALLLAFGLTPPPNPGLLTQVGELWSQCASGDKAACYTLGTLRTVRIADSDERSVATAAFEKKCRAGASDSCFALAMHLDDDGGLPVDGKRAFELFLAACESGFAPACQRASVFYRVSVPASEPDAPKTASKLLAKACDAGYPSACYDLAQAGAVGGAEPVDKATEANLLERGCKLGSFDACLLMADRILPSPPFACDQCEPNPVERGDTRCIDCETAACRKEHCCPTCEGRNSYACCCEEFDVPLPYPLKTPPVAPGKLTRDRAKAHALLSPSVKRLRGLCKEGLAPACRDLDGLFANKRLPFKGERRSAD
jgi:hypothetical protein